MTTGHPNFLEACTPVQSHLKVTEWELLLQDYWEKQLIDLIKLGFCLDLNRNSKLACEITNHDSAIQVPEHVDTYLKEEIQHDAI